MGLFTEATQKDIVEHIVVKNLTATEADEELFEVCASFTVFFLLFL